MSDALWLVAVAVPVPLHTAFDYRVPPALLEGLRAGVRVRVPFGPRRLVGVVVQPPREVPADGSRYRSIEALLDEAPAIPQELLGLCQWAAAYYHHPEGEVVAAALPGALRRGQSPTIDRPRYLRLTEAGVAALEKLPVRAKVQRETLTRLAEGPRPWTGIAQATRKRLLDQGLAAIVDSHAVSVTALPGLALTPAQETALAQLQEAGEGFGVSLLEGVTGSGKTELYLRRVADVIARGGQALVLVPEIGLTPQLVQRFSERFGGAVASFHSGMTDAQRAQTWLKAREGEVAVVVGTRSAVLVPFARLKLIVVDEEHDVSYKQQDGFRYSARDVAIVRAQRLGVPVILGSATPALESLHNARSRRYRHVRLPERIGGRPPPKVQVIDLRGQRLAHGLSQPLVEAVERHLNAGGQGLLFINRRGYAPVLLCHDCGWSAACMNCDARLTLHRARGVLVCHHCGTQAKAPAACPSCGKRPLQSLGQGTERIEDALRNRFPRHRVERFDSDRLAKAGELERLLEGLRSGAIHLAVGTQILAKGHDFAGVSLVGIVNADQALYGADFRAIERMGQLLTQVAGRAGRGGQAGEVLLQTHEPGHPLLRKLVDGGYGALCEALLRERRDAGLPPFAHLALLRADAGQPQAALDYLASVRESLGPQPGVSLSDPVPALMEKRAGLHRAQLLVQSASRGALQKALAQWVPRLDAVRGKRRVRWSIDVDPADLF